MNANLSHDYSNASDATLMTCFYEGDVSAFDVLAGRSRNSLLHQALARLPQRHAGRRAMAEDLVQDTLIKAAGTLNRPNSRWQQQKGRVQTWLGTILRNHLISYLRSRASKQPLSSDLFAGHGEEEDDRMESQIVDHRLLAEQAVREAEARRQEQLALIGTLPEDLRSIVEMKLAGRTHQEIADQLGVAKSTITYRFNAARRELLGETSVAA